MTPAPQATTSTSFDLIRIFAGQRGKMPEHPLKPHILRLAGSLHFAGAVKKSRACGRFGDSHRNIHAFTHIGAIPLRRTRLRIRLWALSLIISGSACAI